MTAIVTAYCACHICCGPACGLTASGTVPTEGRTCAAPRRVPFGTRIHITGVGWRTVEDRTAKRFDGRIDVFFNNHNDARRFGKRRATITYEPTRTNRLRTTDHKNVSGRGRLLSR